MSAKKKIGILGASGYTGADAVRLLARHPNVEIAALTANTHAGKTMAGGVSAFLHAGPAAAHRMGEGRLDEA